MDPDRLRALLHAVKTGQADVEDAIVTLGAMPLEDIGEARLDTHRPLRTGISEVVYCEPKTPDQVADIFSALADHHSRVLGTRADEAMAAVVRQRLPATRYDPVSRLLVHSGETEANEPAPGEGYVAVVTAGTGDQPVAEEAAQTCEFYGLAARRVYDVGVAGIHRLLASRQEVIDAAVVICVAGMEGALPSVVGGLVAAPVVAVPTSVGYGANFEGLSALLAMLNSCATGVAVVNIDNGFGAAVFARSILRHATSRSSQ